MSERSRLPAAAAAVMGAWALAACQMPAPQSQSAASGSAPVVAGGSTAGIPSGTVVAYYGTDIPAGWVLCDGRTLPSGRRTPDLRNRFIMGMDPAGGALLGETGGGTAHRHEATTGAPRQEDQKVESGHKHAANDGHTHDVTVQPSNHLPPYTKLVYIMKD